MTLSVIVKKAKLEMPAPFTAAPLVIVTLEIAACVVLDWLKTETTAPRSPPSIIVLLAPAPKIFKLKPTLRFSVYVAAATRMESRGEASAIACPIVLHAVVGALQSLPSFPFTPSTYHVVLAIAAGTRARARNSAIEQIAQIGLMLGLHSKEFLAGPKS